MQCRKYVQCVMAGPCVDVGGIRGVLCDTLTPLGFEVYPFKIGWYNAVLSSSLHLPYSDDTLAVVVLSTPSMFERAFRPFLESGSCVGVNDPIDQCIRHCISTCVSQCFPGQEVNVSYDYEVLPNRKPKFLAQTAAHVAGAAYYYQRADVAADPWGEKKMFGVCIHPKFGGWFAIRALLVFPGAAVGEELQQRPPPDCVPSQEARVELLERFNFRWQDWSYRDIVPAAERYSQDQRTYFSTPPGQRAALLRQWGLFSAEDSGAQAKN
ncbi:cyanocobalamin reductase / alkylcobalamin dealkylase isoform X1 [Anguilla anguilla]|uniref:cyanocobalamin reductase / alkylcobalamin dealkylase isoform X1 n=2 Tax=Anguilla anguilla TaxID=7936 RepID=UPI0015B22D84|nr:cyanocobalamin reductase / alkylcobalamin dealkylase isoform X1 [Anguilla anguilla]